MMARKKVNGSGNGKERTAPVGEKKRVKAGKKEAEKEKAQKKPSLKYPFDTLNKGQSLTIENADKPAGAVKVRENVRVLAYEFGLRTGLKFKVSPVEKGRCTVTRVK